MDQADDVLARGSGSSREGDIGRRGPRRRRRRDGYDEDAARRVAAATAGSDADAGARAAAEAGRRRRLGVQAAGRAPEVEASLHRRRVGVGAAGRRGVPRHVRGGGPRAGPRALLLLLLLRLPDMNE